MKDGEFWILNLKIFEVNGRISFLSEFGVWWLGKVKIKGKCISVMLF